MCVCQSLLVSIWASHLYGTLNKFKLLYCCCRCCFQFVMYSFLHTFAICLLDSKFLYVGIQKDSSFWGGFRVHPINTSWIEHIPLSCVCWYTEVYAILNYFNVLLFVLVPLVNFTKITHNGQKEFPYYFPLSDRSPHTAAL